MREETRVCKKCGEEREIEKFANTGINRHGKQYRSHTCNPCRSEGFRQWRKKQNRRAYKGEEFRCVYDPTTIFMRALHKKGVFMQTLEDGYWPPGSWWVTERGIKYEVQGNELMHVIGGESKPQRLVRSYGRRQPPRSG
jgi:hypothetical protein